LNKEQLLALVEEGFRKPAWHGPNLRGALRGVTPEQALWRPAKGRHNIWEIAVHAAYWKYAATRRLTGSRRRDFPEKGRNWFARNGLVDGWAAKRWKSDLALLASTHERLRDAIADLKESDLTRTMSGNRYTTIRYIAGIAMHDAYHAGQIQILRKLCGSKTKATR
jgi:hypothetical protein